MIRIKHAIPLHSHHIAATAQAISYRFRLRQRLHCARLRGPTQFDAMAIGIAKAFDVNISRALHDRTPENQPFVYVDDINQ